MRKSLQRPSVRVGLGLAAVVVIAVAAGSIYVFGTGMGVSRSSGAVSAPTLAPSKNGVLFTIDPSASQATFTIDEILFGRPNTVVGKTSQVTGQILVNKDDPAQSQLGVIRIDLSTLVTDNTFRNQALQNRILETSDSANRYATFVAKSLSGLPTSTAGRSFGDTASFQITGDLTIHQVTRTVTFAAQVTVQSATRFTGQAETTVRYQDFNLHLPSVPSVTGVSDNVRLALTFTAHA